MVTHEGFIWSFLLRYDAVGSGGCVTQPEAHRGAELCLIACPPPAHLQGRTTASSFPTGQGHKDISTGL